jgi:hypothetical protein
MSEWVIQTLDWFQRFDCKMEMNLVLLIAGLSFFLLAVLLWLKSLLYPSFAGVSFSSEKGSLLITPLALQTFVATIVASFEEVALRRVRASRSLDRLCLRVEIDASPEANLAAVTDLMRAQIIDACASRLGISEEIVVDLVVVGVETEDAAAAEMEW